MHAYNEQKGIAAPLDVMTADPFEVINLLARGGKATVHAPSRRLPETSTNAESDVLCGPGHRLEPFELDGRSTYPYCRYEQCPHAKMNKRQKCGEGSERSQAGRSRCKFFCPHPSCGPYPAECLNKRHGWGDFETPRR